ncbi:hypothetical protein BDQ17DRAFT_1424556 [Cyathus striatus]|nr:hypothetical protein BDQ17DRAFT_1424556 [Cyathus striatus]
MFWAILTAFQSLHIARAISFGFDRRIDIGLTRMLQSRQSNPDVPAECQSVCDPVNSDIANGCTFAACCTSQFETGYFNCFQCVGQSINFTDFTAPQQLIDGLLEECGQHGFAIPKLTFPGQNPDRSLTTLPISGSTMATTSNIPSTVMSAATSTIISSHSASASSSLSSISLTGQSTLTQVTPTSEISSNFTQSTVSNSITSTSLNSASLTSQSTITQVASSASSTSPSAVQTSSLSSGTSFHAYDPILPIFSTLLISYWLLLA